MMTIKEFAGLCCCSTQTLRYYDKIDLLKPVKVDQWTGYRYYSEFQAIDFVKIKNLQAADFSIGEIKALLEKSDRQVYEAFDLKIAEQAQKLERIKQIQQSYLAEKSSMENIINGVAGFLTGQLVDFEGLREFGLTPEDGPAVVERLKMYFVNTLRKHHPEGQNISMRVMDETFTGQEAVAERVKTLDAECLTKDFILTTDETPDVSHVSLEAFDTVWERHGWEHVYEFLQELPKLEKEVEYCLLIRRSQPAESFEEGIKFSFFMLGVVLQQQDAVTLKLHCMSEESKDGHNHFGLLRKRE